MIEYTVEAEAHSEFSQDLQILLEQMQEENPQERPDIEVKKIVLGTDRILICHVD